MLAEQLKQKIKTVLDSDLTPYRIAKEVGYSSANPIWKMIDGTTKIESIRLETAGAFEKVHEELMKKMENIKEIITKVEEWEIDLVDADPDYEEKEYIDGPPDHFIIHQVDISLDDEKFEVLFAEHDFIKEIRNQVYSEKKEESDLIEVIQDLNELADQYDYDNVVGYRLGNGPIKWL